ncbi:MAG TPA: hypothetical protein VEZ50_21575, partial [Nodosilinea sp.]|nr:hypothetical protein [Nodosilinea sp.]
MGLNLENAGELRAALCHALETQEAMPTKRNAYGQKYQIEFGMARNGKTALVRSCAVCPGPTPAILGRSLSKSQRLSPFKIDELPKT